jgi:hypothetical protein
MPSIPLAVKCAICIRQAIPRSIYCQRCRPLVATKADSVKREKALIEGYDESIDGFRCRWCGVVLDTVNRAGPFSLCFDHLIPQKWSALDPSSMLMNSMKSDLGPDEYPLLTGELARHHNGSPFNRDIVKFMYWNKQVRLPAQSLPSRGVLRLEYTSALQTTCDICGRPSFPHSIYCPTCRRLVFWGGKEHLPRVRALKLAWCPELGCFICYYTGIPLNITDPKDPWYTTFEHRIPGLDETQVMSASWVNAMKTALSEDEFWAVIMEYDRYLREGGEFNKNIVEFRHWNRAVKGRVVA